MNCLYCRKHIEFYRRHGSYVKRSYGAGELRPYRLEAMHWLRDQESNPMVRYAVAGVRGLYASAGAPVDAFRLTGKSPRERARVAWAHLRAREVEPREVLAVWLAVTMRIRDDPQPDSHKEYRHVQVAKVIHRMAGGTHKRWERHRGDGSFEVTQIHRHPISRGQVLRVIGEELSRVCEGLPIPEASFSPQMK